MDEREERFEDANHSAGTRVGDIRRRERRHWTPTVHTPLLHYSPCTDRVRVRARSRSASSVLVKISAVAASAV